MTAPDWSLANCLGADPDLFFDEDRESIAAAKAVCARCVIREGCNEDAIARGERWGVWGGRTRWERRLEIRRRRAARKLRSA